MKQCLLIAFLFLTWTKIFCQTVDTKMYDKPNYYYSKTDFSFVDTLSKWSYNLTLNSKSIWKDTVTKPIAKITFFRTKALFDTISRRTYGRDWAPRIDFEIYNITDSLKCFERSDFTRNVSSCVPPSVGGDIFVVGSFIFLNNDVCLNCDKYDNGIDYCRPTLKKIFSKVRLDKVSSLQEIIEQFDIKQGEPK